MIVAFVALIVVVAAIPSPFHSQLHVIFNCLHWRQNQAHSDFPATMNSLIGPTTITVDNNCLIG